MSTGEACGSSVSAVAFGPRFFVLLAIGIVWIGPAFFDARFLYGLVAWNAFVLAAWAGDLWRLAGCRSSPRRQDLARPASAVACRRACV